MSREWADFKPWLYKVVYFKLWLYKVVDKEVRMNILKDLERELKEVEDGFVSNEHDVKGHFFHGVKIRHLKNNVFEKMEIYKFDDIS